MKNIEAHQAGFDPSVPPPIDAEAMAEGYNATAQFLAENAEHLGRVFGIPHIDISVAEVKINPATGEVKSGGWATNLETEKMTADPRFFIERGYTSDMAAYATTHEVAAHLREVILEPSLTREVKRFKRQSEAASIFHNIFADIAGNNYIHATLSATKTTAANMYSQKLFPETDYTDGDSLKPRHLQFLYKIIRDEMIPGSETTVFPEVDEAIASFRNFDGKGDLIKYSTAVATSDRKDMPAKERFDLWTKVIYPKYLELLEQDKQDGQFKQNSGQQSESGEGEPSDQQHKGDESPTDQPNFDKYYKDYNEERHPEPMTEAEHEQIHREVEKRQRAEAREKRDALDPRKQLDAQIQAGTGHSLRELERYQSRVDKWQSQIQEMRDVFKLIINERVSTKRRLQGNHIEGPLLNPDTLAQIVMDVNAGIHEPAAFMDYEHHRGDREITGRTDWIFIIDHSGSMKGEKSQAATDSILICLEGLSGMHRDIMAAEEDLGTDLDLDIRTAIYTFNSEVHNPKQLSHSLTEKERLDTYSLVSNARGGNADSEVLAMINELPVDPDRRQNIVVIADGEADDTPACEDLVRQLRAAGWNVFGIAIGSEAAEKLYAPDSRRVDDPNDLTKAMKSLIEANL
jgi:hypothetical protein